MNAVLKHKEVRLQQSIGYHGRQRPVLGWGRGGSQGSVPGEMTSKLGPGVGVGGGTYLGRNATCASEYHRELWKGGQ